MRRVTTRSIAVGVTFASVLVACSDDSDSTPATTDAPAATTGAPTSDAVTLVAYDSFPTEGTPLNDALAEFTSDTGIAVELLIAGDTGAMLSKAALTAGNPEGDVMWGVDNTYLSRAVDAGVFAPYESPMLGETPADLRDLVPGFEATPVDYGDVCVNYDIGWFEEHQLDPPADFDDLLDPVYADLLVVENPATSSPGLAFLLATIATYGDGWRDYWTSLTDNGVEVIDGWTEAYYERFSWAGGPRPLVVSYASSPPAEVIFADPPRTDAPTSVVTSTCFRQVEFAGVLDGTDSPDEARALVDFLASERFQRELPLTLFVYPADASVELPPEFVEFTSVPESPLTLDPDDIEANRSTWIDEWTEIVLG
ncbi:MAG TPA: thiamine ABC transporter substrate-binding protein [Ilumatobacteraceae bacterium]|nr:thiamine ABC transporter substrate-binding protein [Ilumatobacteraceae bacterium]